MEKKLFCWEDWDEVDFLVIQFYNCTLHTDIGQFKAKDKIYLICMDYVEGRISFIKNEGDEEVTYRMELSFYEQAK